MFLSDAHEVDPLIPAESLREFLRPADSLIDQKKHIRRFYQRQNDRIHGFLEMHNHHKNQIEGIPTVHSESSRDIRRVIAVSFCANVILFFLKVVAAIWSLSLALIASAVDSFLDLLSGSILFFTERAGKHRKSSLHLFLS